MRQRRFENFAGIRRQAIFLWHTRLWNILAITCPNIVFPKKFKNVYSFTGVCIAIL